MGGSSSRRDGIKAAATRLFEERGVEAVSVREIAAACGMAPPNLYAHFAGKAALAGEIFHEGYAEYGRLVAGALGGDAPGGFPERLDGLVRLVCRLHDEDEARFRLLLVQQHCHLGAVAADNPVEAVREAVARAMEAGEIPRGDPDLVSAALIGAVVQAATFRLYGRLPGGLSARADELSALCLKIVS